MLYKEQLSESQVIVKPTYLGVSRLEVIVKPTYLRLKS